MSIIHTEVEMKVRFLSLSILLALIVVGMFLLSCTGSISDLEKDSVPFLSAAAEKTNVLFLGDSIGEALAGPSPLTEREAYGYYGIIGNINSYNYYNRAVSGYTTKDLSEFVRREDDGVNRVRSLITNADIIHISIIGNDFLFSNRAQLLIDLADDVYDRIREKQAAATKNLDDTLTHLRSLNPDAVIILQTLYNPCGDDSPLIDPYARAMLDMRGITQKDYHDLMKKLVLEINKILYDYLEAHTTTDQNGEESAPFELIDVYTAFDKAYEADPDGWDCMICEDGIHPQNAGHALIAEVLQDKLTELGLAAPNALHNYKRDRVRQLNRLYSDHSEKQTVRDNIMKASDFSAVSHAYFEAIGDLIPHYDRELKREGKVFAVTRSFKLTFLSALGSEYTGMIDKEKAEITFTDQGDYILYLPLTTLVTQMAKYMIKIKSEINANELFDFDLAIPYLEYFTPGADKYDLEAVLKGFKYFYGFEIIGLDYDNPILRHIFDRYRETGELIIDDPDFVGETIALKCTGSYSLETIRDSDGTEYSAIYVNNVYGQSEPFIRYTYTVDEDDVEKVRMTIDVVRVAIEGIIEE